MYTKLKSWFKNEIIEDPIEYSAAVAYGIGMPVIIIIFYVLLYLLK